MTWTRRGLLARWTPAAIMGSIILSSGIAKAEGRGRIAVLLDDGGETSSDIEHARFLAEEGVPATVAVLPYSPRSEPLLGVLDRSNLGIMLHQPMAALDETFAIEHDPPAAIEDRIGIYTNDTPESAKEKMLKNLAYIDQRLERQRVTGVNNHAGSAVTQNRQLMEGVMTGILAYEEANRELFFVDSRTVAGSIAYDIAREHNIVAYRRAPYPTPFLDQSTRGDVGQHVGAILATVASEMAPGELAVLIGHIKHPATVSALTSFSREQRLLQREGKSYVELCTLPQRT